MSAIELNDNEWQQVFAIIGEQPWRIANPLLMKMGQQLQAQQGASINPVAVKPRRDGKELHHE